MTSFSQKIVYFNFKQHNKYLKNNYEKELYGHIKMGRYVSSFPNQKVNITEIDEKSSIFN